MKSNIYGGEGGIRTLDRLAPIPVFETGAIDHSATSPRRGLRSRVTYRGVRGHASGRLGVRPASGLSASPERRI